MNRNEKVQLEPFRGEYEESIPLIEATDKLRELLDNPPEILELHVYWCVEAENGKFKPDRHGEICIEGVAEYLLLLKERNEPMPLVAVAVGFTNLYNGESMSTVYSEHLKNLLLEFGFTDEEVENCIQDEAKVKGTNVATDTRGELEFLQHLSGMAKLESQPLCVSREFHGVRIQKLIETNNFDMRYISAEELLALLNPGRLTELVDESTLQETEKLRQSEQNKLKLMSIDKKGLVLQFLSDTLSGRSKELLQEFSRRV